MDRTPERHHQRHFALWFTATGREVTPRHAELLVLSIEPAGAWSRTLAP
jgi:hypothetical protein